MNGNRGGVIKELDCRAKFRLQSNSTVGFTSKHIEQLGTFFVNGECVCSPFVAKFGPTGAERVARSQLDRYVLSFIQSVIIKSEIQCIHIRVITLLNDVYLTASYTLLACMPTVTVRARLRNCQYRTFNSE